MARADRVLSTPPTNTSSPQPFLPPPVIPGGHRWGYLASQSARRDGHALAHLMRLREEAAAEVDRLLAFLDATEGNLELVEADLSEPSDFDILEEARRYDLETDDDEPSLGWTKGGAIGSDTDLELAL